MSKRIFFILSFITLFFIFPPNGEGQPAEETYVVIPEEAIRLRILANSNSDSDQHIKYLIRDRVNEEITSWVHEMGSIDDARTLIKARTVEIDKLVEDELVSAGFSGTSDVTYSDQVAFPEKTYGPF